MNFPKIPPKKKLLSLVEELNNSLMLMAYWFSFHYQSISMKIKLYKPYPPIRMLMAFILKV